MKHRSGQEVLPGGVNSPVRAWAAVGGDPVLAVSARGSRVTFADEVSRVDMVGGWGPALLGHAHPDVVRALATAAASGLSMGATTHAEVGLAATIHDRYPPAQMVRLVSTGTEAAMTAVRLARAATGRDLVVTFAGHYHGHSDGLLAQAGSGVATLGVAGSAGVPDQIAGLTVVLPYGNVEAVEQLWSAHGNRVAAVLVEAAPANMGVIQPPYGFLDHLARSAHDHGALLILDEVLTGFRVGPQGWWGLEYEEALAAEVDPWQPDLVTFGKVIGGGMPVAAVAGRADVMDLLAPAGPVYQAGTLSGNPVAVAAGLATMQLLDDDVYLTVGTRARQIESQVGEVLTAAGVAHAWGQAGSLFSLFLGLESPPLDYSQAKQQDTAAFARLFHAAWQAGVSLPPSAFEAWFVSAAHTEEDVAHVVDAVKAWVEAGA